jgi:UDP-N-acetylmuramoylalanine--D-glutamate ligase
MMMDFSVRNLDVTVVGAARSGLAAVDLLQSRGARVTLADMSPHLPENVSADELRARGVRVELGPHTLDQFAGAQLLVVSPGVPLEQPALEHARNAGVPIIGELELAARWANGRVIAITGTKGKSTTTTLTSRMLTEAGMDAPAVGNIGAPWCARVDASTPATHHVVEASSFQLESIDTFHPWIAVLLNLSPDHLDRHSTVEAYAAAKQRVFLNQTSTDWAVVNADDPSALALAKGARARRFDFSLDGTLAEGVTVENGVIVRRVAGVSAPLLPLGAVNLPGRHLLSDVLAAAAVAHLAGVPPEAMHKAVSGFHGLAHALERVAVIDGITYINDSKATNIASAKRAIESFAGNVVVILGGRYKGGRFEDLADVVAEKCAAVIAIGEAKGLVRNALSGIVPVHDANTMADAVSQARALVPGGGTVLLAPACSSFDMFTDYQARGRAFVEEVRRMSDGQSSVQAPR